MDIKKYVIFDISEIDKINFDEVYENSKESLRISNNNKSFIKYVGDMPTSIYSLESKSEEYTEQEILNILSNDEWNFEPIVYSGSTD